MQGEIATNQDQSLLLQQKKKKNFRKKLDIWLLLLPTLLIFIFFFLVPLVFLFVTSFKTFDANSGIGNEWTFQNYIKFLTDSFYLSVLWRTVKIALLTTLITIIISYPVAYQISKVKGRLKNFLTLIVLSPLLISMVIRSYGWVIILSNKGVINNTLMDLGIINQPLTLLYTEFSVILGMIHVLFPYMVLTIMGSLERIDPSVIRASQNLGASSARTFFSVMLPLTLPGIFAGSVMVFSLSVSSFVTPAILGGPQVKVMSYLTYEQTAVMLNWPYGSAIGFLLIFLAIITIIIYSRILAYSEKGVAIQ
ncbi:MULTISPECIES: ABC transporter permease subunit [Heyndrickxia]|jgi:putative spermidine/putrescine transport system permease protein|uniref:ABC transporter permease subunit n=1 Tax=Heyndrickxia TaxID=2837504 RepID=UPI0007175551|nr:ABC transporter permease [Heyndrickxia oleronia]MCI1588999.1 ABC transporter permease [Heyndrickxia oleronia]MCI1611909.1 ABC transporter permease [Heyndrickxia oleronia]MCI1743084.1 ABC transporter permease [Heyndrickxia oleronia]MCI1759578.1 ABC transporter permease [Heyndrickxia oleronia]